MDIYNLDSPQQLTQTIKAKIIAQADLEISLCNGAKLIAQFGAGLSALMFLGYFSGYFVPTPLVAPLFVIIWGYPAAMMFGGAGVYSYMKSTFNHKFHTVATQLRQERDKHQEERQAKIFSWYSDKSSGAGRGNH